MGSLSSEDTRRLLRHAAVIARWETVERSGDPKALHAEWSPDFGERRRGLTRAELGVLVDEHRAAIRSLLVAGFGGEINLAVDYLSLARMLFKR